MSERCCAPSGWRRKATSLGAKGERPSPAYKRKVSEGLRRRYLESLQSRSTEDEPTHKPCARCKKTKAIAEFPEIKKKLASGVVAIYPHSYCRTCEAKRVADWKQKKMAEGTWDEYRRRSEAGRDRGKVRRYQREYLAIQRREEGIDGNGHVIAEPECRLPAAPLAAFLKELEADESRTTLAGRCGVNERRLYAIVSGEQESVSLNAADAILTGLGFQEKLDEFYPLEESPRGYRVLDPKGVLKRFAETGEVV